MSEADKKVPGAMYRIIGQVKTSKTKIVGYMLMRMPDKASVISSSEIVADTVRKYGAQNAIVGKDGLLVGTDGSLTRLPVYNESGALIENPRVTVLGVYPSKNGKRDYHIMDAYKREKRCTPDEALKIIQKSECTNAKIVNRDGKMVISAIMGEFISYGEAEPKTETKVSAEKEQKAEKWSRPANSARYLTKTCECKAIRLHTAINACKAVRAKLRDGKKVAYSEVRDAKRGLGSMTGRVLRQFSEGRYGAKTKKHYPLAYAALEKHGNIRAVAQSILAYREKLTEQNVIRVTGVRVSTTADMASVIPNRELDLYLEIMQALYVDCLTYSRTVLAKEYLKELATILSSKQAAQKYLQDNTGLAGDKAILAAAKEACKGRIDSLSQAMFISALELIKVNKCNVVSGHTRQWIASLTIGEVGRILKANPMRIEDEKDYGGMLFQALILVMSAK